MHAFGFRILLVYLLSLLSATVTAFADDLKVKVVDPQSAAVAGAQVTLFLTETDTTLVRSDGSAEGVVTMFTRTATTSAEGIASFKGLASSITYQVQVLAAGFAPYKEIDPGRAELITAQLQLAVASETVVVSATRTPVVGEAAGADVDTLNGEQLTTMQPVAANDAVRFLPGAVVNTAGQRGGLASLFVRGGESNYNKVIVDGVTINEPGGTFDFGTLSLTQGDRLEFVRGTQSTLYGSDAMTSLIQVWTRTGSTRIPELSFGSDGGNFETANGYASVAGARGRLDYNVYGDQFNTNDSGVNDASSNSLEGANIGGALNEAVSVRARVRHSNSHTGLPGEWSFNGYDPIVTPSTGPSYPLPPNPFDSSQLNNILGSVELIVAAPSGWQHRFTGFDYLYRYHEQNPGDPQRISDAYGSIDFASDEVDHINRGGFEYQGDYSEKTWAHTTFGYRVENENGFVGQVINGSTQTPGQRLNNDVYLQQQITCKRISAIAGGRFVHDSVYGNTGVPRVALAFLAAKGGEILSGTRLRFSYATGFKEPRLEETYAGAPYSQPNPGLKPERVRSFEAGLQQDVYHGKYAFTATYFNNLFHDQINYVTLNPTTFLGEYVNVNKAFAQGAEIGLQAKLRSRLLLNTAYTYTSTQILDNPAPIDSQYNPGQPLLRRPKHSATMLLSYLGNRWGANLSGSFVGRRPDDDFDGFNIFHAAGYVRADLGGWYAVTRRITAYVNVENALDRRYNEVVGYPALPVNFRAGMRFRVGGE